MSSKNMSVCSIDQGDTWIIKNSCMCTNMHVQTHTHHTTHMKNCTTGMRQCNALVQSGKKNWIHMESWGYEAK